MRRVLSMFIGIMVLIGLLPATAHAGTHNQTVTSVTIKNLDYPIAGKKLDTSYSVPTDGVYYTKSTSNSVVTWYDQGTSGIGTTSSGEVLEANAVAENGHYYMAKIELMDVVFAGQSETGAYFANGATVEYGNYPSRLKSYATSVAYNQVEMTVYLFFKADYLYTEGSGYYPIPSLDIDSSLLNYYYNSDDDWGFEVVAGTKPWTASSFEEYSYNTSHYSVETKWYKEKTTGVYALEMDTNETFEAGKKYKLRVILNSEGSDKNATFDDSVDVRINANNNEVVGEKFSSSAMQIVGDFICVAKSAVNGVTIEGIQNVEPYAQMQTSGFMVGNGVKITSAEWYQTSGVEFDIPVTGAFQPNTDYRLYLELEPEDGYVFSFTKEDVEANAGTINSYYDGLVKIDFSVGAHTHLNNLEWTYNDKFHWKECVCQENIETADHNYNDGVVTTEATCKEDGVKTYTCTVCGKAKTEILEKHSNHTYNDGVVTTEATCKADGVKTYTCTVCENIKPETIAKHSNHTYNNGEVTTEPTTTTEGVKTYTCQVCGEKKTEKLPIETSKPKAPEKNTVLTDAKTGEKYTVVTASATVSYTNPKNKNVTKVVIPSTVTIDGITYKVTSIEKNAFSGCKKLKSVTIGKNVETIGDKAFYKCTALTQITIPSKVTKIGKSAFSGCKKLKNLTIKTTKLTSKKVGSNAFKGTPKNAKVKVPKKSLNSYKKFLYKKGLNKKASIKK